MGNFITPETLDSKPRKMRKDNTIYVSIGIETDGPNPMAHNLLSLGAVSYDTNEMELGDFYVNLTRNPERLPDPNTMEWWKTQPKAWAALQDNQLAPSEAMASFVRWCAELEKRGTLVAVCYPTSFDFTWVHSWCMTYANGAQPFGFSRVVDMKSLAWGLRLSQNPKALFQKTVKAKIPVDKRPRAEHTHVAVDDAREQAYMFFRLREALSKI